MGFVGGVRQWPGLPTCSAARITRCRCIATRTVCRFAIRARLPRRIHRSGFDQCAAAAASAVEPRRFAHLYRRMAVARSRPSRAALEFAAGFRAMPFGCVDVCWIAGRPVGPESGRGCRCRGRNRGLLRRAAETQMAKRSGFRRAQAWRHSRGVAFRGAGPLQCRCRRRHQHCAAGATPRRTQRLARRRN